jgi:ABC-type cobalamin/Fe3+-siderophores transport system ATPase subunit
MRKIILDNIKGIKHLELSIPEKNGIYLLVGANGSGKTTVLVCLDRICNPQAFAYGFRTPRKIKDIDQYAEAVITYEVDSQSIEFRKGVKRWEPIPRGLAKGLFNSFGFNGSVFIKADSKRLEATGQEIEQGTYEPASIEMVEALNFIFETNNFEKLNLLKVSRNRGQKPTYFYVVTHKASSYSEQRFSTGELAIIRLVEALIRVKDNTLVLLDEAEMALHPRIQKNLLDYIKKVAEKKNLMIFIATHSTSLVNATPKENLFLLDALPDGNIDVIHPCYPAQALGNIDFLNYVLPDYIFFVEDLKARLILEKMIDRYLKLQPESRGMSFCIIPVGGYQETAKLAVKTKGQLFSRSQVFAVLDEDAFSKDFRSKPVYSDNKEMIHSLGLTPEQWLIDKFEEKDINIMRAIKQKFSYDPEILLKEKEYVGHRGDNPRKVAKKKFATVISFLTAKTGDTEDVVEQNFVEICIDKLNDGDICKTLGLMLRKK